MPKTYSPPPLTERQRAAVENGEYDFLVPTRKALMRTDEVANVLHRSQDFVRALADDCRLERHSDSAQTGGRPSGVFTRRSVILYLAETSNYDPAYIVMRLEAVMRTLKPAALDRLITFCQRQKHLI